MPGEVTIHICLYMQVSKPNIGENHPASVRADITLTLNLRDHIKAEWECKPAHLNISSVLLNFWFASHANLDYVNERGGSRIFI